MSYVFLYKVESKHRPSSGLVGEIVDHHMDLVFTLDNDVSFCSWYRHSRQFSCASLVTIREW